VTDSPRVDAILFDLGGTLFRYGGRQGGAIRFLLGALGIEAPPEQIGLAWRKAADRAGEHYGRQRYFLHRDLFRDTFRGFLDAFGHAHDEELFQSFHLQQLQGMLEHLPIREECHDALQALRDRGLYLSVVSNIDDDYLYPLLDKHGLLSFFDHCTSSEEARSCKPDPDIFHYALGKAGRQVHEALFVGDSLHHDVAGAHRVGMRSARIVDEGVQTPLTHGLEVVADPTYEITALTDLIEIVDRANRT
jgi:HAD superfamily hydrolase (TIGR01509 family)